MSRNEKKEIIYVGDPMCAWCFGFAPVLGALIKRFGESVPFRFIMGGLRVEDPIAITDKIKPKLLENWEGVTRSTGQPINGHLLANAPEFIYNSGPASRAFVTVRHLDESLTLPYYQALHHAFYMELKDISRPDILCDLSLGLGLDPSKFSNLVASEGIARETEADFELAAAYNAQAFPSLVLKEGDTASVLNQGYKPLDTLEGHIADWVSGTLPTSEITPALLIFGRAS